LCTTVLANGETKALIHPVTGEVVNETNKVLCYANKEADGRFKDPQLYKDHGDNPNSDYFDTFDYLKDKFLQRHKRTLNKRYYQLKKSLIKKNLSSNSTYQSYYQRVRYLDKKIGKSRGEIKKTLRLKRIELLLKFNAFKKEFISQKTT
jgi:hypothetical protein